jgi:hypothetical protein
MQSRLRWLFFFITILSIASMAARVPLDTDMWWHIRTGEVSLSTHQPLVMDTFSYTRAGQPWVNHSWLAQILLAFLYQKLSFYGLTLYVVVLSMLTFGLLFFLLEGHPFIKAMLIIFGSAVVSTIWSPRPQLFTLLFLCLLVFVVTRYREGKVRPCSLPFGAICMGVISQEFCFWDLLCWACFMIESLIQVRLQLLKKNSGIC